MVLKQWIKNKQHCKRLVIVVPVAPPQETLDELNQVADEVIVLYSPLSFEAVGQILSGFFSS